MKFIPSDEALHVKNKVTVEQNEKDDLNKNFVEQVDKSAVKSIVRPKENKKFLWTYLPQYLYLSTAHIEEENLTTWQKFKRKRIGRAPIYYDSLLVEDSEENIAKYLFNKGYFNPEVDSETTIEDKKSKTNYILKPNLQWIYGESQFVRNDSIENYDKIIEGFDLDDYIKKYEAYDVADFKELRSDITEEAYERGFYRFDKNAIFVEPDTLQQKGIVDVDIVFEEPEDSLFNKQFRINDIYVKVGRNFNEEFSEPVEYLDRQYAFGEYSKIRPKVLHRFILLKRGELYSKSKHQNTIRKMYGLPLINYSTIEFNEVEINDSLYLDAYITANTKLPISLKVEPTFSLFEGPALALKSSLQHRNAFDGGEFFDFSSTFGVESTAGAEGQKSNVFGTQYLNIEPKLTFYRLLGFDRFYPDSYLNTLNQSTILRLNYGLQKRVGLFNLEEISASQAWDWQSDTQTKHNISLVDVSYFRVGNISEYFQDIINQQESTRLAYQNRLIFASRYTLTKTNQANRPHRNFYSLSTSAETAGNLAYLLLGKKDEELTIRGTPVARYVRGIVDFKYNIRAPRETLWVNRIYTGISQPIGESNSIPAIKQFYSGGNSSLRAWNARAVGPGSYDYRTSGVEGTAVDLRGDFKLELNSEYRFPFTKIAGQQLEGAVFTDAGNIWMLNEADSSPRKGTNLTKDFYKEIALDAGAGLRLKVANFFSVRADLAIKLRDPILPEGDRWVEQPIQYSNSRWSFGIGYPF